MEGFVGLREHGGRGGGGGSQDLSHSYRLGTLAGEDKGYAIHWLLKFSSIDICYLRKG